jgi:hypothetical protein
MLIFAIAYRKRILDGRMHAWRVLRVRLRNGVSGFFLDELEDTIRIVLNLVSQYRILRRSIIAFHHVSVLDKYSYGIRQDYIGLPLQDQELVSNSGNRLMIVPGENDCAG